MIGDSPKEIYRDRQIAIILAILATIGLLILVVTYQPAADQPANSPDIMESSDDG